MATLEARAVADLAHVEVDTVVNQQRLIRTAYALSGVIVLFCLYAAFTPKSILDSTRRALFLADVVRPTNTRLVNVKPGADPELSKVVAGTHVPFAVDVQGVRPQSVMLHFSVDGGKFFAVREFAAGSHLYDPWQVTLTNVQQSMDYYLTGGDAETLRYHLEVRPAPTITSIDHDLAFPKYTKLPPRAGVEGGMIEAIEGTKVTIHAKTNMPAMAANLNLAGETPITMTIDSDDRSSLTGEFTVQPPGKSATYTIDFRTASGQHNPSPVTYDILSIADRPPTARFIQPDKPAIKVPANVKVALIATGNDDHAVKQANLLVLANDERLFTKDLLEGLEPKPEFRVVETLDLEKLHMKPGSKIQYKLTVWDNKDPMPSKMETALQLIEVIEPVAAPEKKKVEEALNNQQQPDTSSNPSEETNPSEAQPNNATPDEQDAKPQQAGDKSGASSGNSNEASGGKADGGKADETRAPDQGDGGGENQNQLTSAKEKKLEDMLRNRPNKPNNAAGKEGDSPSSQDKSAAELNQANKTDASENAGKGNRPQDQTDRESGNTKKPGKMENSGRTNPQGGQNSSGNEESNGQGNEVKRGEQSKTQSNSDPGAGNDNNRGDKKPSGGQREESGGAESGNNNTTDKGKGSEGPGEAKPGERAPEEKPRGGEQEKTQQSSQKDKTDSAMQPKDGNKGTGDGKSNGSPDGKGNRDGQNGAGNESEQNKKAGAANGDPQAGQPKADTKKDKNEEERRRDAADKKGGDKAGENRQGGAQSGDNRQAGEQGGENGGDHRQAGDQAGRNGEKGAPGKKGEEGDARKNETERAARKNATEKGDETKRPENQQGQDEKMSGQGGKVDATPKSGKEGSDSASGNNKPKTNGGSDSKSASDSSSDPSKSEKERGAGDKTNKAGSSDRTKAGESANSGEQPKSSDRDTEGEPGKKGESDKSSETMKKQTGRSTPGGQQEKKPRTAVPRTTSRRASRRAKRRTTRKRTPRRAQAPKRVRIAPRRERKGPTRDRRQAPIPRTTARRDRKHPNPVVPRTRPGSKHLNRRADSPVERRKAKIRTTMLANPRRRRMRSRTLAR